MKPCRKIGRSSWRCVCNANQSELSGRIKDESHRNETGRGTGIGIENCTALNFTRAAEVLSYVPSNVTMQIKALEDKLGFRLFNRLGKQLTLTTAGKRFLTHAQGVLEKMDEARSAVHDNEKLTGTLTISANSCSRSLTRQTNCAAIGRFS